MTPSSSRPRRWVPVGVLAGLAGVLVGGVCLFPLQSEAASPLSPSSYVSAVQSGTDVVLSGQTLESVTAGRDAALDTVTVRTSLTAGRDLRADASHLMGALTVGRDVSLTRCPQVGSLSAGRSVTLSDSQVSGSVKAGRAISLRGVSLTGDITAGDRVLATDSTINGVLHASGLRPARLENVDIQEIHISAPSASSAGGVFIGSGVVISGNASVHAGSGPMRVAITDGGVSSVNGYTVKGSTSRTTVLTPDGAVYVNGERLGETGPPSYARYRALHSEAPLVQGPGWPMCAPCPTTHEKDSIDGTPCQGEETPKQVIELLGTTRVRGAITFEAGHGVVILHPGASVAEPPKGGRIERPDTALRPPSS